MVMMPPGALLLVLFVSAAPAAPPTPRASAAPPLHLDIEGHVEHLLEEHQEDLRFETEVDVVGRTPEEALAQHFRDFDLECGPTGGSAPTVAESREFRPRPPPAIDFLLLSRLLSGSHTAKGPDRYFLYRLSRGATTVYTVREERLGGAAAVAPGGTFELVETFPDLHSAVRAWQRMERGFGSPVGPDAPPPAPWATTNCRPRKR